MTTAWPSGDGGVTCEAEIDGTGNEFVGGYGRGGPQDVAVLEHLGLYFDVRPR